MSDKLRQEKDEERAILLDLDEDNRESEHNNIQHDTDDEEMLLLSSASSASSVEGKMNVVPKAGPSGLKAQQVQQVQVVDLNSSNILIEDSDSDSEESLENSIEVIGSEEDDDEDDTDSDDSNSAFLDGKVQVFMAQGSFFIWNAEDVQMLREECRIVGKLVGCLPRAPRQNNHLGLPLQLMPEEAKLLEEIEAACVVEEQDAAGDITQLRKTVFEAMRENNYKTQQGMYKESRKQEVIQHKDMILEGKRSKKRKIQELENAKDREEPTKVAKVMGDGQTSSKSETSVGNEEGLESVQETEDISHKEPSAKDFTADTKEEKSEATDGKTSESAAVGENSEEDAKSKAKSDGEDKSEFDASSEKEEEKKSDTKDDCVIVATDDNEKEEEEEFNVDDIVSTETHMKHSLVQLFTENPWRESVKRPKHWIFPLSQKEYLRYEVFRDLWKKGYYLTSGSKFGGDYLVYPGDPARYHSHFIAVCIDKTIDLSALDIISLGRLGSNVRKTVLLCAFNKSRQITYTSLQWTGIS